MSSAEHAENLPSLPAGMRAALRAARRGAGRVSPNPSVGACLEIPGRPLRTAHHSRYGGPHAEALLLDRVAPVGRLPEGSVLYVTLEPCCHEGKRPPCVDRILAARPSRVVVAAIDPFPLVNGEGIRRLRRAGVPVTVGVGAREAIEASLGFHLRHRLGRSALVLKLASSLDARLARADAGSRWISGPEARRRVHRERARADAVLVGADTVLHDRPRLNVRAVRGPQPSRIVVDSALRIPVRGSLWRAGIPDRIGRRSPSSGPLEAAARPTGNYIRRSGPRGDRWEHQPRLIVATAADAAPSRVAGFRAAGWEVWPLPTRQGHVSLRALLRRSAREGLLTILAEAGPKLAGALLQSDLVDEVSLYLAPVVLGGGRVWPATSASGQRAEFELGARRRVGKDLWMKLRRRGRIDPWVAEAAGERS